MTLTTLSGLILSSLIWIAARDLGD